MSPADEERMSQDPDPSGGKSGGPEDEPGSGGYAGRDPATDMPRVPSAPETQEDPQSHDAAPDDDEPRQASE